MTGRDFVVDFPVPPLFRTRVGEVMELVFWSPVVARWIHGVSEHFERHLPRDHVQVTVGDLTWLRGVVGRRGLEGLRDCISDLEEFQAPSKGTDGPA